MVSWVEVQVELDSAVHSLDDMYIAARRYVPTALSVHEIHTLLRITWRQTSQQTVRQHHLLENFVKGAADRAAALLKSLLCHTVGRVLAEKYRNLLFH